MSTAATVTELHRRHHDDYEEAKREILQSIGSLDGIEVLQADVLVACYVRPQKSDKGFFITTKAQYEDVYMGKVVLILKCGPDAFKGDESYMKARFGAAAAPKAGDWCVVRPTDGVAMSVCGAGFSRPQGKDYKGEAIDLYDWDGWPCRLINHEVILLRVARAHEVV